MQLLLMGPVLIGEFACLLQLWRWRKPSHQTSLKSAWSWGIASVCAWIVSTAASAFGISSPAIRDQLWYWTAILSLCPLISILGARRPTARVWDGFVVLPLLAVLGWPAVTTLASGWPLVPLSIQSPVLVGFALVLLMGTGNFLGTRFSIPVVLYAAAVVAVLVPLRSGPVAHATSSETSRCLAAVLFCAAGVWGMFRARTERTTVTGFDRLWLDFQDLFGIVWSRRLQDRLNATATHEKWASRVSPLGWSWETGASAEEIRETERKMEHALRWHLRRFVDAEWITARLETGPASVPRTRQS